VRDGASHSTPCFIVSIGGGGNGPFTMMGESRTREPPAKQAAVLGRWYAGLP